MPPDAYLQVVPATNMKQRVRKLVEYTHAETRNYAVLGTPNRLEYALGFFVRGGDGLADVKPIAHLYKTQVFALAAHLGVDESIRSAVPSTDTYSLPQTQEEFYFGISLGQVDLMLYAQEHDIPREAIAEGMGLSLDQVDRVLRDMAGKRARGSARLGGSAPHPAGPGRRLMASFADRARVGVAPLTTEDRSDWIAFQARHHGADARQADPAWLDWLAADPEMPESHLAAWICRRNGVIVGSQGSIPFRLKEGDALLGATWAVDLMVEPGVAPARDRTRPHRGA